MQWHQLYALNNEPDMQHIGNYINNKLWKDLIDFLESGYHVSPDIQYSRCSAKPGWNVKFKKSGRALCTLYPDEGFFTCMVSIGNREAAEAELLLLACTPYIQKLYREAGALNGSRWLMIEVRDEQILSDVKELIKTRVKQKKT